MAEVRVIGAALGLLLFLVFLPCLVLDIGLGTQGSSSLVSQITQQEKPRAGRRHGSSFLYQLPPGGAARARGVLFLAHGCQCKATFFWDPSPSCPDCLGLPEDRVYVREAVSRRLAVIAISSTEVCWSQQDQPRVLSILSSWIKEHGLSGLPVFGLGASSGGYFVSRLATKFKFAAVVIMIAEGVFSDSKDYTAFPRTLFVHMPRDEARAVGVARSIRILRSYGVQVAELQCKPLNIGPSFFAERIRGMDTGTSRQVYQALRDSGLVGDDGFLAGDGRSIDWRSPVRTSGIAMAWDKHIQEELNLAFAYHEMTSLPCDQVFGWLLGQVRV